jgi:hypothetical protein
MPARRFPQPGRSRNNPHVLSWVKFVTLGGRSHDRTINFERAAAQDRACARGDKPSRALWEAIVANLI